MKNPFNILCNAYLDCVVHKFDLVQAFDRICYNDKRSRWVGASFYFAQKAPSRFEPEHSRLSIILPVLFVI